MKICPSCGRENPDDARFCSQCATPLEADGAGARGAQGRHLPLLRPRRLHGAGGAAWTPRTCGGSSSRTTRACAPSSSASAAPSRSSSATPSWPSSARPSRTRTTPSEQCALRSRFARRSPRTASSRSASASRPARRSSRSTPDRRRARAWSRATSSTRPRDFRRPRPPDGILVDETTYAVRPSAPSSYEEASAIDAKGKSRPIAVWERCERACPRRRRATQRARSSSDASASSRSCEARSSRVAAEREPQLVTLVGVPGIGKSRLVSELFETIRDRSTRTRRLATAADRCRTERASPSGRSARSSRRRPASSSPTAADATATKLRQAVESVLADPAEAGWVERHLRPLAGLDADETSGSEDRERGLRGLAALSRGRRTRRPLVLVFEDLALGRRRHARLRRLPRRPVERACRCSSSARLGRSSSPDVPDWGGGKVNSSTILLSPLSEDETAVSGARALLGARRSTPTCESALLERAGGNPLYAEEFARMLVERPTETVLPETVQGHHRRPARHAPTRGEGAAPETPRSSGKCLLARVPSGASGGRSRSGCTPSSGRSSYDASVDASVAGEDEYVFRHALVRDVAYEQIPRAERADMHRRAAEWIESLGRTTTTPRCSPTTTRQLSSSCGSPVRTWAICPTAPVAASRGR